MVDEAQAWEGPRNTSGRHGLEMGVYLSVVLTALLVGLEQSLDNGEELLLIWGTSLGLTLAHIFAFRLASVYEHGISFTTGWRPIGAMVLVALAVGATGVDPIRWLVGYRVAKHGLHVALDADRGRCCLSRCSEPGLVTRWTPGLFVDDSGCRGIGLGDQVSVDPLTAEMS